MMVEMTDNEFKMNGINEKDWAKIYLHLRVHQKDIKIVNNTPVGITIELKRKYIITYLCSKQEILVSTHPDNIKNLKEMLYHFMNCACKIDDAINKTDTFDNALILLGIKK